MKHWVCFLWWLQPGGLGICVGREKAVRGLREKPISTSVREGSPPAWSVFVAALSKMCVQKLMFVEAKEVRTLRVIVF